MHDTDWLADRFEAHRTHLRAVAYRMLGSTNEADDAVQETWVRLSRSDSSDVENLGGWMTTIVSRICLDMLRSRAARREELIGDGADVTTVSTAAAAAHTVAHHDPEHEAILADALGSALLVVLDTLSPAERLAFVLHDMFAVPFDQIGEVLDRSPIAVRQLASRARRRIQGADAAPGASRGRQRDIVDAFLSASREGNFGALLELLHPDVVLRADSATVAAAAARRAQGAPIIEPEVHGAAAAAAAFAGRARDARLALIDGAIGAAWAPDGQARAVFEFTLADGRIVAIDLMTDPDTVRELDLELL